MKDLARVSRAREEGLPYKPATFYAWHYLGKYPEIFVKLGGGLFIDKKKLHEVIDRSRTQ